MTGDDPQGKRNIVVAPLSRHGRGRRGGRAEAAGGESRVALALVNVRGEMLGQIVGSCEAFATHLAVIGPLAGVDAQVPGQVAFATERAAAEQADERPLAGVLAHVELQVLLRPHALAAERAGEAPFATIGLAHRGGGAAVRKSEYRLAALVPVVVHGGVYIHVAGLAAGTSASTTSTTANPAGPGGSVTAGLRDLHLHRFAGILLDARGLRDALVATCALGERAARLFSVARVRRRVAARLHLGRLAGAGHLVAAFGRRRDHEHAALRLGRALQSLERVIETVLLKGL